MEVCWFNGAGGLGKNEGGGVFEEGVDTPMHTKLHGFIVGGFFLPYWENEWTEALGEF